MNAKPVVSALVLFAWLGLGACSKTSAPEPPTTPAGKAAPTKAAPQTPPKTAPVGGGSAEAAPPTAGDATSTVANPGSAYFGVDGTGLVRLQDGKFTVMSGIERGVRSLALAPDGALWVSSFSGLFRVTGDKAQKVGDFRKPGMVDKIAIGKDGHVWCTSFKGVWHFDGKTWTLEEKAKLGEKVTLLRDIAVDAEGRVWLVTPDALYQREKEAWSAVDVGKAAGAKPFFETIALGPDGSLYLSFMKGLLQRQGESWTQLAKPRGRPTDFAVASDGRLLVIHLGRVSIITPGGKEQRIDPASAGFKARDIRHAAVDGAGRFWLSTDFGVVILDRAGRATQWEPGMIKEVSGRVESMAMVGNGPNLPRLGAKVVGAVTGKVIRGGSGVAGAEIEICEAPSMLFRKTPCGSAVFFQQGKTDGGGNFKLTGIPVGTYRFAIKAGPKWVITLGGDCCAKMKPGQEYDIGSITLKE